eukprot:COSAG02_NODE_11213_length_1770_cov_0.746260_3_plen_202_part_00
MTGHSERVDRVHIGRSFSPQKSAEVARLVAGDPIYYGLDGQPDAGVPFEISELEQHVQNENSAVLLGGVMMMVPSEPEPEPEPGPEPEPEPIYEMCIFSRNVGGWTEELTRSPEVAISTAEGAAPTRWKLATHWHSCRRATDSIHPLWNGQHLYDVSGQGETGHCGSQRVPQTATDGVVCWNVNRQPASIPPIVFPVSSWR